MWEKRYCVDFQFPLIVFGDQENFDKSSRNGSSQLAGTEVPPDAATFPSTGSAERRLTRVR